MCNIDCPGRNHCEQSVSPDTSVVKQISSWLDPATFSATHSIFNVPESETQQSKPEYFFTFEKFYFREAGDRIISFVKHCRLQCVPSGGRVSTQLSVPFYGRKRHADSRCLKDKDLLAIE